MKNKFLLITIFNLLFCSMGLLNEQIKELTKSPSERIIETLTQKVSNLDLNNGKYIISNKNSEVEWVGKKLYSQHSGLINIKQGFVIINNDTIEEGEIIIDMTSIIVTDIESDKGGLSLANHLKDPDFFNVESYPYAYFKITDSQHLNRLNNDGIYYIRGELKILDITKPYIIQIKLYPEEEYIRVIGKIEIDRTDFNITYGSDSYFDIAADRAISNIFDLNFKLIAIKDTITKN